MLQRACVGSALYMGCLQLPFHPRDDDRRLLSVMQRGWKDSQAIPAEASVLSLHIWVNKGYNPIISVCKHEVNSMQMQVCSFESCLVFLLGAQLLGRVREVGYWLATNNGGLQE